jgi:hypothetical protein
MPYYDQYYRVPPDNPTGIPKDAVFKPWPHHTDAPADNPGPSAAPLLAPNPDAPTRPIVHYYPFTPQSSDSDHEQADNPNSGATPPLALNPDAPTRPIVYYYPFTPQSYDSDHEQGQQKTKKRKSRPRKGT